MLVASAWESTLKVKVMLVPVVSCMSGVVFELILPAPVSETVRVFTPPVTFALGNVHVAPLRLGSPSVTEGGGIGKNSGRRHRKQCGGSEHKAPSSLFDVTSLHINHPRHTKAIRNRPESSIGCR